MVYKPSNEEMKKLIKVNEAYVQIAKGIKQLTSNLPIKDTEVDLYCYQMCKLFDKVNKRTMLLLEKDHINKEFNNIINLKAKNKDNRFKEE